MKIENNASDMVWLDAEIERLIKLEQGDIKDE